MYIRPSFNFLAINLCLCSNRAVASSLVTLQFTKLQPVCLLWAVHHDQPRYARSCSPTLMDSCTLADPEHKRKRFSWQAAPWLAGFTSLLCRSVLVCLQGCFLRAVGPHGSLGSQTERGEQGWDGSLPRTRSSSALAPFGICVSPLPGRQRHQVPR